MKSAIFSLALGSALSWLVVGCSPKVEVPSVTGFDLNTATTKLTEKGFTVVKAAGELGGPETPPGSVLRQRPAAGQSIGRSSVIELTIDDSLFLPSYLGLDLITAQAQAPTQRVQVARLEKRFTGKAPLNSVVAQSPLPNTRLLANSPIVLIIEDHIVTPNLSGLTLDEARLQIEQVGLRLGRAEPAKSAAETVVINHLPKSGQRVAPGSAIDLVLGSATAQNSQGGSAKGTLEAVVNGTKEATKVVEEVAKTASTIRDLFKGRSRPDVDGTSLTDGLGTNRFGSAGNSPTNQPTPSKKPRRIRSS